MRELTLSQLQQEAYRVAVARGQWPRGCRATVAVPGVLATVARRAIGEEATELTAALSRLGASGPLDPVADELADVVIVCASIAEALGIDLERAVRAKMRVNAGRAKRQREEGDDDRLTPERLEELRRIAQAATPGPWRIPGANVFRVVAPETQNQGDPYYRWAVIADADPRSVDGEQAAANACYIAAFHPPTVLALLDEIERLRRLQQKVQSAAVLAVAAEQVLKAWVMGDYLAPFMDDLENALLDFDGPVASEAVWEDIEPDGEEGGGGE